MVTLVLLQYIEQRNRVIMMGGFWEYFSCFSEIPLTWSRLGPLWLKLGPVNLNATIF